MTEEGVAVRQRPWAVLMVCTGNVCRSPLAEHLAAARFSAALDQISLGAAGAQASGGTGGNESSSEGWHPPSPAGDLLVSSAGVCARAGEAMYPQAAAILTSRGLDPSGFRARLLTPDLVQASDLVLCATRAHRSTVVGLVPRAMRRTFTLREFGRVTSGVRPADIPPGGTRAAGEYLAATARRIRAAGHALPAALDDLADPLDGGRDAFENCARMIEETLSRPMALLAEACHERLAVTPTDPADPAGPAGLADVPVDRTPAPG
ncbi:protein-tyrosine-phosphatase [Frankia sp. CcI156]|uniref:Protein tyrosine phosphatase n=1 Tax=Frankia casuarinae (strain DSM 45818 / CECT 9043 / HFP020203 / CcI3) TaxID=106370 RepID=Q2JDH5_FRACC|nr:MULTISPECIES: protein-tyrosine-phosphatase [Frankia]ABD10667.1 protein tyrosine phosphatase [Frankia casuarinae]ETA02933.1 protein-tyrosine-phosphatase [Frankia sp. CcI6]EYT93423.1 protein-tyrosine-phosphatase [Frankia casuarinae]KDA43543.1 protein-tyrosine-phosphatase [Frankia sp. BMG5.23]KEZ36778.1 protein-tyrosine-phosphatase [Frankia sp. CeD]